MVLSRKSLMIKAFILLLVLSTGMVYGLLAVFQPELRGLYGVYYNNMEWKGIPYATSFDTNISTTTLKAQQARLPQNRFSVEWKGYINIPKTDTYIFFMSSEDGSWLFIDDALVVDNSGAHDLREAKGKIHLKKGSHRIAIQYFQKEGDAVLNLSWAKGQEQKTPLTAEFFLPLRISVARFWIYRTGKSALLPLVTLWCLLFIGIGISRVVGSIKLFIAKIGEQRFIQGCLVFLILILFFSIYYQTWLNTFKSSPNLASYAPSISMIISEKKYGAEPLTGYNKIYNLFVPHFPGGTGRSDQDWGPDFSIANKVIQKAMNLDDVSSEGTFVLTPQEEGGLVTYYRLAFGIYGYKAESAFYLYWLFIGISMLVFLFTFFNRPSLLFFLLVFACSFLSIVQTQGIIHESIIRNRFFPILAILPSFYLIFIIYDRDKRNWRALIGTAIQALILSLITNIRPSAIYSLLFLGGGAVILLALKYTKFALFSKLKIQLWPLVVVVVFFAGIKVSTWNPIHHNLTGRNATWHMLYMGLGAHPESEEKYNISWGDLASVNAVKRRTEKLGYKNFNANVTSLEALKDEKSLFYCGKLYEKILKEEFFNIFKQDPWFVIGNYWYKLILYFKVYFSPLDLSLNNYMAPNYFFHFGVITPLLEWVPVIALLLGIFLIKGIIFQEWFFLLVLSMFGFLCSLLPPMLAFPVNNIIADSALYFTIVLLLVLSVVLVYIIRSFYKRLLTRICGLIQA